MTETYDLNMNLAALRRQVADLGSDLARLAALHEQLLEIVKPLVYASLPGYEAESEEADRSSLIAERDSFALSLVGLERVITEWLASDMCPLCGGHMDLAEAWSFRHNYYCPFLAAAAAHRAAELRQHS